MVLWEWERFLTVVMRSPCTDDQNHQGAGTVTGETFWTFLCCVLLLCYDLLAWRLRVGGYAFYNVYIRQMPPLFRLRLRILLHILILALMTLQEKIVFTCVAGQISVLSIVFLNCPGRHRNRALPRCSPKHVPASD